MRRHRYNRFRRVNEDASIIPASTATTTIQRKTTVGKTDDPLEHEADRTADKIMRMPERPFIQRKGSCSCGEYDDDHVHLKPLDKQVTPFIQTKVDGGNVVSNAVSSKIQATRGGGKPIDSSTKSFMESRFGADFDGVKIHTGDESAQLSRDLSARAFTIGRDIYFNNGQYQPDTGRGKHLLAHELTHVLQQKSTGKTIQRDVESKSDSPKVAPKSDKISDADLSILAAIIATEANMGQEEDLEWVYLNLFTAGKSHINESTPFRTKADTYKFNKFLLDGSFASDSLNGNYLKNECKNLKGEKNASACDSLTTIESVYTLNKSYYDGANKKRVKQIENALIAKFSDTKNNPGFNSNGNLDDLNRQDGEWPKVRQYLILQDADKDKTLDVLIKKLGTKEHNFEVVYKKDEIMKFFQDNPDKLPKKVNKYP
jgi:hypothetical protein